MASVQLKNAQKYFGDTHVIRGVDIDIEDGQFTVLVGPSGCGKSTLLRVIAGLESLSSGEVLISGISVNNVLPKERDIAMVFQNYALYPHMTVFDNMAFSLKLAKLEKAKILERVNATAETLGLTPVLTKYPRQLSGGQRQRVAMGRAIVRNPKLFLFDEPLSNLDATLRTHMRTEIKTLQLQLKTTSIYVTHDQIEAMTIADKLVVMRDGKIEQMGKSLDVYDRPENTFVAGFIGSPAMNFISGVLHKENEQLFVKCSNDMSFSLPSVFAGIEGQAVILGIRPEHLSLHGNEAKFTCHVVLQEPTGAETQLVCRLEKHNLIAILRERCDFISGQMITLHFDMKNVHFFDQQSGKSLRKI